MSNDQVTMDTKRRVAMVEFPDHMTEQECNDILVRMMKAGYCKPTYDNKAPTCRTYEPWLTSPTLYFP